MSRYQGNEHKAGPRDVEMQDFIQAEICYEETITDYGPNSPEALEKKARLDDVISRLHPMDM